MLKKFEINPEFITDVRTEQINYRAKDPSNPTPEELVEIIKYGPISSSMHGNDDHPEFKKLRNLLEDQGYIITERNWWNGDRVLKPFKLNGMKFLKHEQFPCAAALGVRFRIRQNGY